MKNIVVFDTSYGTFNMGDFIINKSANEQLSDIFKDSFLIRVGTHNPVAHFYQTYRENDVSKFFNNADLKFLMGTNIIDENMLHIWPQWNVNIFNYRYYKNTILVGCGLKGKGENVNLYSKLMYKLMLRKDIIHSVRDEKTKLFLESMGYNAINTGCPTMWRLNRKFCESIPKSKAQKVVFTLTDYIKDELNDQKLINILNKNYKEVYFWVQGVGDLDYLNKFNGIENIHIIDAQLENFDDFLNNNDCDYIGTRLHAGIFSMQHIKRSIILIVDNRAKDIKETYNINTIERNNIDLLEQMINSEFETRINIDEEKIKEWKSQFLRVK